MYITEDILVSVITTYMHTIHTHIYIYTRTYILRYSLFNLSRLYKQPYIYTYDTCRLLSIHKFVHIVYYMYYSTPAIFAINRYPYRI